MKLVMLFSRRVLRLSSGIDDMGPVMWDLALALIVAWLIVFLALFKGIKISGKVELFSTTRFCRNVQITNRTKLVPYRHHLFYFWVGCAAKW